MASWSLPLLGQNLMSPKTEDVMSSADCCGAVRSWLAPAGGPGIPAVQGVLRRELSAQGAPHSLHAPLGVYHNLDLANPQAQISTS